MKAYSYNQELMTAVAQFIDALCNDIVIKRKVGSSIKSIAVKSVYGDRSRVFKSIENPNKTQTLPIIVASIARISRDPGRVAGVNDYLMDIPDITTLQDGAYQKYYNNFSPNPINITFNVDILAAYHSDFDQIISNFIAFCNPSFYVVTQHPKLEGAKLKHQIVWDGEVAPNFSTEVDDKAPERFGGSTTFVFKTWIFPGDTFIDQANTDGIIKKINFTPMLEDDPLNDGLFVMSNWHAVGTDETYEDYTDRYLAGKIRLPYYDWLPMIAGDDFSETGQLSGYWSGVSAMVSGLSLNSAVSILSGDPVYLVDAEGNLLIYSEANILPPTIEYGDILGLIEHTEHRLNS